MIHPSPNLSPRSACRIAGYGSRTRHIADPSVRHGLTPRKGGRQTKADETAATDETNQG